jgi:hypothetical protein
MDAHKRSLRKRTVPYFKANPGIEPNEDINPIETPYRIPLKHIKKEEMTINGWNDPLPEEQKELEIL